MRSNRALYFCLINLACLCECTRSEHSQLASRIQQFTPLTNANIYPHFFDVRCAYAVRADALWLYSPMTLAAARSHNPHHCSASFERVWRAVIVFVNK